MGIASVLKNIAPVILYGLTFIVAFISLFGKPKIGLFYLIPLIPLQNVLEKFYIFPLGKDINDILLICMIIGWFINAVQRKEKFLTKSTFNGLLIFMIIYTYFSLWQGSFSLQAALPLDPADPRLQTWKNYAIFPLLFFLVFNNIKNRKDMKILFIGMLLSILLMDYYTVNQVRWAGSIESRNAFRGTFMWLGANEVAAFYAIYTFVLIGVFFSDRSKALKSFLFILILLNIYCLLFIFSRGAYAAFLVGMSVICLLRKKMLLIPIFLILISWQTLLPPRVVERITQTTNEQGELDVASERRLIMWKQSMNFFKQNVLIGAGFNIFPYLGFELGDTHNVFIKILAEQGIIGIIIIFLLFFFALRSSWKLYRTAKDGFLKGLGVGFIACIFAAITVNMFGDRWTYMSLGAFFWVFLGMVECGNRITQKEQYAKKI